MWLALEVGEQHNTGWSAHSRDHRIDHLHDAKGVHRRLLGFVCRLLFAVAHSTRRRSRMAAKRLWAWRLGTAKYLFKIPNLAMMSHQRVLRMTRYMGGSRSSLSCSASLPSPSWSLSWQAITALYSPTVRLEQVWFRAYASCQDHSGTLQAELPITSCRQDVHNGRPV